MAKYSLLEMKKRNYGRILLIASIAGKEVRYHSSASVLSYSVKFQLLPADRNVNI